MSIESPILAPGRRITSLGADNYVDDPALVAELWGKSVTMSDYTLLYPVVKGRLSVTALAPTRFVA